MRGPVHTVCAVSAVGLKRRAVAAWHVASRVRLHHVARCNLQGTRHALRVVSDGASHCSRIVGHVLCCTLQCQPYRVRRWLEVRR